MMAEPADIPPAADAEGEPLPEAILARAMWGDLLPASAFEDDASPPPAAQTGILYPERADPDAVCSKCAIRKPREAFSPSFAAKNGLSSWCKACHRTYAANRRQNEKTSGVRYLSLAMAPGGPLRDMVSTSGVIGPPDRRPYERPGTKARRLLYAAHRRRIDEARTARETALYGRPLSPPERKTLRGLCRAFQAARGYYPAPYQKKKLFKEITDA